MPEEKTNGTKKHAAGSSIGSFALGAAIAGVIGAGLGMLFAPKKGAETRKDIAGAAKKAARHFKKSRAEVEATLKRVFGTVTSELTEQYVEVKGKVLALVHEAKQKGAATFTRERYDALVDETVDAYAKAKKWSKEHVAKMRAEIKEDWKELED